MLIYFAQAVTRPSRPLLSLVYPSSTRPLTNAIHQGRFSARSPISPSCFLSHASSSSLTTPYHFDVVSTIDRQRAATRTTVKIGKWERRRNQRSLVFRYYYVIFFSFITVFQLHSNTRQLTFKELFVSRLLYNHFIMNFGPRNINISPMNHADIRSK